MPPKTVNVQVDEQHDIKSLTDEFNTTGAFTAGLIHTFGTSEQFEAIRQQLIDNVNFIALEQGSNVSGVDGIGDINVKANGILRLSWLGETQTIDELDEIDDIDDIDELDDLDLDLLYEFDADITINKEQFKKLLQASGII